MCAHKYKTCHLSPYNLFSRHLALNKKPVAAAFGGSQYRNSRVRVNSFNTYSSGRATSSRCRKISMFFSL